MEISNSTVPLNVEGADNVNAYTNPPSPFDLDTTIVYSPPRGPLQFHIATLSISLIVGLAYGGFVSYKAWFEGNTWLSYIRNLVIALVCRTFFSLLFEGIILGDSFTVAGAKTLMAFEVISLNLVLAFWLVLTIYFYARLERSFSNEPELRAYQIGIPGVAVFFALVWIFVMEDEVHSFVWIPPSLWIAASLRLLYLLVQIGLLVDLGRKLIPKKSSFDNDSIGILRNVSLVMAAMVFLLWLHFGFGVGRPPWPNPEPFLYFRFLIDGLECALSCPLLYFFEKWVLLISNNVSLSTSKSGDKYHETSWGNDEILVNVGKHRGVVTVDSVFVTPQSGEQKRPDAEEKIGERSDVVYSSVVHPENLKKTLDLYKRLNVLPKGSDDVTLIAGEEFYECKNHFPEKPSRPEDRRSRRRENTKEADKRTVRDVVKKNAFYSSKYLIVESRDKDAVRCLESFHSISSNKEEGPKDAVDGKGVRSKCHPLMSDELVENWLKDCSGDESRNVRTGKLTDSVGFETSKKPVRCFEKDISTSSKTNIKQISKCPEDLENSAAAAEEVANTKEDEQKCEQKPQRNHDSSGAQNDLTKVVLSTIQSLLNMSTTSADESLSDAGELEETRRTRRRSTSSTVGTSKVTRFRSDFHSNQDCDKKEKQAINHGLRKAISVPDLCPGTKPKKVP